MPKKPPPGVHKEWNRHKVRVWYYRPDRGKRIRIRAPYGTKEFYAECEAAAKGEPISSVKRSAINTLEWAVREYQKSTHWNELSRSTQKVRAAIFRRIIVAQNDEGEAAGGGLFTGLRQKHIIKGRDDRAATPAAARHFVDTMRGLCTWGVEAGYLAENPTIGVATPKKSGDGFAVWTDGDIARFEARWPLGTRERVAFSVLLYTGLRRGDASRFGRPHVKGNVGRITTEKTGEHVVFRLEQPLLDAIAAGPVGEWTYIAREDGRPFIKESFGNWFREVCTAAGVTDKSAHGLRKAAATRDAEDGWTEAELDAKYGWRGGRMAAKYTDKMNREKLALAASDRVKSRTPIPAPANKVREIP